MKALTPWRPLGDLATLRDEVDSLFGRFFGEEDPWARSAYARAFTPAVETFMREGELVVRMDLPGIDPKEVELSVEGDRLTVRGERKENKERKDRDLHIQEVRYGRFERTLALPHGVDADSVKATYRDGVLEVAMKAPKELTPKKVPISVH